MSHFKRFYHKVEVKHNFYIAFIYPGLVFFMKDLLKRAAADIVTKI